MIINKQLDFIGDKELGFDKEYLVHIDLHHTVNKKTDLIKEKFLQNPNKQSLTHPKNSSLQAIYGLFL